MIFSKAFARAKTHSSLCLVAVGLLVTNSAAHAAKMYQWIDPTTGTVQLAGAAPPWYRSAMRGPRVRVYEQGKVIDDTAYAAPDSPLDSALPSTPQAPGPAHPASAPVAGEDRQSGAPAALPTSSASRSEEFKALLEAWDREQARQELPAAAASTPAPPTH